MYGEYSLQANGKSGRYDAKVCLNAEWADREIPCILAVGFGSESRLKANLRAAAHFGLAYVWDAWMDRRAINVEILDISWYLVDTPAPAISYATVFAFLQAIDWQPPRIPRLDVDTGDFTFPRWLHEIREDGLLFDVRHPPLPFQKKP